jgi:hypothetical protein
MTTKDRDRLADLWTSTGNTFDLMVREIDRAVRRARREERRRLRPMRWDEKQQIWRPR